MNEAFTPLPLPTLLALREAVTSGGLACPVGRAGLLAAGFGAEAQVLEPILGGLDRGGVAAVLDVVIAERVHRPASHLELVWTGPLAPQSAHRDTGVVMRQLFGRAERSVIVGGFRFDAGADLFAPLYEAMVERHVAATFFLDIEGHAPTASGGPAHARMRIEAFVRKNWPFGDPKPDIYYDPRTAVPGPPWVSLHAKCVVVDERWCLVTSANFTDRAQTRNIELGVLIEDAGFARGVAAQWRALIGSGHLAR